MSLEEYPETDPAIPEATTICRGHATELKDYEALFLAEHTPDDFSKIMSNLEEGIEECPTCIALKEIRIMIMNKNTRKREDAPLYRHLKIHHRLTTKKAPRNKYFT